MRKVTCQCCPRGYERHGVWIVFDHLIICDECRLAVINYWLQVQGFTFAPHPFLDEFCGVESRTK